MKKDLLITKKFLKLMCFVLCFSVIGVITSPTKALASWNRGQIEITVPSTPITLNSGGNAILDITFEPTKWEGLEGCQMPECPQMCGEKSCVKDDQCQCVPGIMAKYEAKARVSSSNANVAIATYNEANQQITITGVSKGTAKITVVGFMHEHTDSNPVEINVTVN